MNNESQMQTQIKQKNSPLIIGYYPVRAKAQVTRLLCEYLHIPYVDLMFTPDGWNKYKQNEAKKWIIKDVPFIIDDDFVVTGTSSLMDYVIDKAGRNDLQGRNMVDQIKIDSIGFKHDLRSAILGLICNIRPTTLPQQQKAILQHYWNKKIEPILCDYENECQQNAWYYGYITIMDFLVYEVIKLIEDMFPNQINKFKKLVALKERVGAIKEIEEYEQSDRAVKQVCPVRYFLKFREQAMRNLKSGKEMDVQ